MLRGSRCPASRKGTGPRLTRGPNRALTMSNRLRSAGETVTDMTQLIRTPRAKYRFATPHGMLIALPISLALWAALLLVLHLVA